ncbi:hypothetical protein G9F72_019280 [Clostridium estertheticum]|uniref:hypothetical protein n=1 Tax=Clostridium estertheticum TaxID=238834 RepID=UPI0013E98890|nr:hypothetical protein [Clostridium estertheticum]MBZ9688476.1 hypothetical protein [Clostridium estertheticum]
MKTKVNPKLSNKCLAIAAIDLYASSDIRGKDLVEKKEVVELNSVKQEVFEVIENPVGNHWEIELFVCIKKTGDYCFKVKLTSKLQIESTRDKVLNKFIYVDEFEFEDNEKYIRKCLRQKGIVDDKIYKNIVAYVQYLKINQLYSVYDETDLISEGDKFKSLDEESIDCYNVLLKAIQDDPEAYPHYPNPFNENSDDGVLEVDYGKAGYPAVIIKGDTLKKIIDIEGKNELEDILRNWRKKGLLLSGDAKQKRLTIRYTFCPKYRGTAYVIKIDQRLYNFAADFTHYKSYSNSLI